MGNICIKSKKPVIPETEKKIIFVLGGPGSGKGTVCARLVKEYGYSYINSSLKHLSAGDLLREEVQERPDSELSMKIQNHMKEGTLVPSTVIVPLLKQKMEATVGAEGFLIDGFPRETDQAELFEKEIGPPTHVLFLECSQETMLKRLLKRAETSNRVDDNEATIKKRFETFMNQSIPVVNHYETKNLVSKIDGNMTQDEAYAQVGKAIDAIFPKKQ